MALTDGSSFGRRERTAQLHNRQQRLRAFQAARDHPDDGETSAVLVVIQFGLVAEELTTMRQNLDGLLRTAPHRTE
jgi:hypothetical protein